VPAFLHEEHIVLQESLEPLSTASRTGWSLAGLSSFSVDGNGTEEGGGDVTGPEGPPQSKSVNNVRLMDGLRLEPEGD